ncbi:MAG: c-type cytochrome biogenesis protein CcmI [Pseudomonadota bacterium]
MIFWISSLVMIALAVMCVLWPLARKRQSADPLETSSLAFFKAQLNDVETRLGAEDLTASERATLESERTEIARRLIRAAKADAPEIAKSDGWLLGRRLGSIVAICFVPVIAFVTYATLGSPGLRDEPLSARVAPDIEDRSIQEMVAMAEKHLASNPDDLAGWTVLVGTYKRLGRAPDVARVTEQVMRLDGRKPVHLADLAEALTVANGNIVPERASLLLNEALAVEPEMPKALFYAALALEQEDKKSDALGLWQRALALRTKDERWQAAVRSRIVAIDPSALPAAGLVPPPVGGPLRNAPRGPSPEDVQAASQMSEADRAEMVKGMVAGLADRLQEQPNDLPGWEQLIRSHVVLQNREEAARVFGKALLQFSSNPQALSSLERLGKSLSLSEAAKQ